MSVDAAAQIPALELRVAQVKFGGMSAVNDVSLRIPRESGRLSALHRRCRNTPRRS
jgi:ABC-type uncharacterized transport system ATPase subunit